MKIKLKQGKWQVVVVCLIMLSGCQDDQQRDQFVKPIHKPVSIKSEKVKQEERQEFERCLKAAESGDVEEQNNLGVYYANGVGVKQDFTQAEEWYCKAARQGHELAKHILAAWETGK